MNLIRLPATFLLALLCTASNAFAQANVAEIASVKELAEYAARSGNTVRMKPGVYRMADYLTDEVAAEIKRQVPDGRGRPPVWMIHFSGGDNRFELGGVVLEIDTALYRKLPGGYTRCLFISGERNTLSGLTIRNVGENQGSNGNVLSVFGNGNTLENVSLHVFGSQPYGFGDLLGKGGPGPVSLQKQSGIMVAGQDNTVRRCRVISRAFGHCFYIQKPTGMTTDNVRIEDCYAEGVMRPTSDMLRDTTGLLAEHNFRTIAENRDGRMLVVAGYMKSLVEDGFRTYGGTGKVTLVNCTAVNTRAGFEIAGPDDAGAGRTLLDGGNALGCERAYLIGSNVTVRNSRGDTKHGPLLYLRGGRDSDVELELTGDGSDFTVHALATIAGEGHRVRLFTRERDPVAPSLPIMLGFGMPEHAEMASPIRPADAKDVRLLNEVPRMTVIRGAQAAGCTVESVAPVLSDDESRTRPERK